MEPTVLEKYRSAGSIARDARLFGVGRIVDGRSLLEVADSIEDFIRSRGAKPAFPVNMAIDDVAAHYTPRHNDKKVFENGQLVKIDVGVHVDGYIGDTAETVEIGTTVNQDLIAAANSALRSAIEVMKPGIRVKQVGQAIERTMRAFRARPISNLTGHSMERYNLHAGKSVPNIEDLSEDMVEVGEVYAIEPFSTTGTGRVDGKKGGNIFRIVRQSTTPNEDINQFLLRIYEEYRTLPFSERWCARMDRKAESYLKKLLKYGIITTYPTLCEVSKSPVAQAEHTVIITENGCEVTTM